MSSHRALILHVGIVHVPDRLADQFQIIDPCRDNIPSSRKTVDLIKVSQGEKNVQSDRGSNPGHLAYIASALPVA